jgi:hypothetical protein
MPPCRCRARGIAPSEAREPGTDARARNAAREESEAGRVAVQVVFLATRPARRARKLRAARKQEPGRDVRVLEARRTGPWGSASSWRVACPRACETAASGMGCGASAETRASARRRGEARGQPPRCEAAATTPRRAWRASHRSNPCGRIWDEVRRRGSPATGRWFALRSTAHVDTRVAEAGNFRRGLTQGRWFALLLVAVDAIFFC